MYEGSSKKRLKAKDTFQKHKNAASQWKAGLQMPTDHPTSNCFGHTLTLTDTSYLSLSIQNTNTRKHGGYSCKPDPNGVQTLDLGAGKSAPRFILDKRSCKSVWRYHSFCGEESTHGSNVCVVMIQLSKAFVPKMAVSLQLIIVSVPKAFVNISK